MLRAPIAVLAMVTLSWAAHLAVFTSTLPERVATHFGLAGAPDGWMSKAAFVTFSVSILAFVIVVFVSSGSLFRILPRGLINVPNRDYWLAPERRAGAARLFMRWMLWALSGLVAFLTGVNHLVWQANARTPPRLHESGFIVLLAVFLVASVAWVALLFRAFAVPRDR